jgi:ethanolamine utilization protein EutA
MADTLLSVGIDVGTTTTQLIVSRLTVENKASAFSVPEMEISDRQVVYQSPIHFTPLLGENLVDGEKIRDLIAREYEKAGIRPADVDTGAVIITGETSRKENARAVTNALSEYAGDFVVATAGPDLESVLAAKGAGADVYSGETGAKVLHMDIGGGTANLAWIEDGRITQTGCMNVGGRLVKLDNNGVLTYVSTVLDGIFQRKVGERPALAELEDLAETLVAALEMAAGLRPPTDLLEKLWTRESGMLPPALQAGSLLNAGSEVLSFSGGVADCIGQELPPFRFGDLGPVLGNAIRKSRLCAGKYRLGEHTIRATVIGAGCHSAQLSGSTVFYQNVTFPMKNLPVAASVEELSRMDGPGVLALTGRVENYAEIRALAEKLALEWPKGPVYLALESDAAKALGQALAIRLGRDRPILCIDRVHFGPQSYLDVGKPLHDAIPVVVKTLILSR